MRFPRHHQFWIVCFASLLIPVLSSAQSALDLNGQQFDPIRNSGGKVTVLVFVRKDCPISGRYAPELQRLSALHRERTNFYLVFPDREESAASIHKYLADFHYSIPALRDPAHSLVKSSRAQVTPEAAVFDAKGALVYHGRIDNLYASIGHARRSATTHDLEDAIANALAGHSPSISETQAVGCYISDLE